jgi:anti-repressor protein
MTELIKVTEEKGSKFVSARELYEFLEVKSKFADWFKNRVSKYGFEENQDYVSLSKNLENGGREIDYVLRLDMAKELSIVENNKKYISNKK